MTEPRQSSRKRRWRSMHEAYGEGQAIGFLAACELFHMLEDPAKFAREITEMGENFSAVVRAAREGE